MFNEKALFKVMEATGGFEVTLGFRDDVDHFIGGRGSQVWYLVRKGSKDDCFMGTWTGSGWQDVHLIRKRGGLTSEDAPSGKTLDLILRELAAGQKEVEESGRSPSKTELYGHPCSHYSFSWGERACKISDEYGITVEYSNINDESAGFRLRGIETGETVKVPCGT